MWLWWTLKILRMQISKYHKRQKTYRQMITTLVQSSDNLLVTLFEDESLKNAVRTGKTEGIRNRESAIWVATAAWETISGWTFKFRRTHHFGDHFVGTWPVLPSMAHDDDYHQKEGWNSTINFFSIFHPESFCFKVYNFITPMYHGN